MRALYLLAVVAAALFSLIAPGCGGKTAAHPRAHVVRVTERDFHISIPKQIPAGDVVFSVRNYGPDDHELLIVKESSGASDGGEEEESTPLRPDGLTVDEDKLGSALVKELEAGVPGVRTFRINLKPGRYEVFCNMAGHYFAGMESGFVVQ